MSSYLDAVKKEIDKCTRCGACQSVCPVHRIDMKESSCARGKIYLLNKLVSNGTPANETVAKIMSKCLLCKACVKGCAALVDIGNILSASRREMANQIGMPLAKRLAFTGLAYRKLFNLCMKLGSNTQGLFFKRHPSGKGMTPRIPLPSAGLEKKRLVPSFATKNLQSQLESVLSPPLQPRARVAFFPGCMFQFMYPDIGIALIKTLQENDIAVIVPERLFCCGMAATMSGDISTSLVLAEKNLQALAAEKYDAIITGCASCGDALLQYKSLPLNDMCRKLFELIEPRIKDVSAFLMELGLTKQPQAVPLTITWHDPCHLVRGMNVKEEPRNLLKSIPGVEFVEMTHADTCCGCGGTFSLEHYELSRAINDKKIQSIIATKADAIATGCPACKMHIQEGLTNRKASIRVLHPVEVLMMSYKH